MKRLAAELMVERAMLERELELVKDEGVIPGQLSNLHKTQIIDSLRARFPLTLLLRQAGLKPSSYQYCETILAGPQSHGELRLLIRLIASESGYTYGSPRIWQALRRAGVRVSEKVIRRLMKEERIPVFYARRKRQCFSYEGETTPAPIDRVNRKFRADRPGKVWLTDVSEFPAPDAKVYLSPMVDCFDGKTVAWRTSRSPDKALTQGMLEDAIATLSLGVRERLRHSTGNDQLVVHTDRGGHYRGAEWIEAMKAAGLTRSMGRKGKSGDNAACEGFFGRMKTEMFHGRIWENAAGVEDAIAEYMEFYNNTRIKTVLGGVTIAEYREAFEAKPSKKQS